MCSSDLRNRRIPLPLPNPLLQHALNRMKRPRHNSRNSMPPVRIRLGPRHGEPVLARPARCVAESGAHATVTALADVHAAGGRFEGAVL